MRVWKGALLAAIAGVTIVFVSLGLWSLGSGARRSRGSVYREPIPAARLGGLGITLKISPGTLTGAHPEFTVQLANLADDAQLTIPTYGLYAFAVRVWDAGGQELTDIEGFDNRADLGNPSRADWVTLGPRCALELRRPAVGPQAPLEQLPRGKYRACVTLRYQRQFGDRIPSYCRAEGDGELRVWVPPPSVDNVAHTEFTVG